jgi:hypothetical protein
MFTRYHSMHASTFYHGPPHPFKDGGVLADSLTGIRNAMLNSLYVVNRSCIYKGVRCSTGLKSGERGGHATGPPLPVCC